MRSETDTGQQRERGWGRERLMHTRPDRDRQEGKMRGKEKQSRETGGPKAERETQRVGRRETDRKTETHGAGGGVEGELVGMNCRDRDRAQGSSDRNWKGRAGRASEQWAGGGGREGRRKESSSNDQAQKQ